MAEANETSDNNQSTAEQPTETGATGAVDQESLIAQRDQYLDMAQRARAELDNYQKRVARDMQTERKYAAQPVIADLLPAFDNLARALDAAGSQPAAAALVEGIQLVRKQLLEALAKHGVQTIEPTDEPFDPNQHEAVMQQAVPDKAPMTVLKTLQAGYRLHDRVIRPAQVIVSA